jgi:hypothetical protein
MSNHNETSDDLVLIIKKGFDGVDEQFKKVHARLDGLDAGQEEIKLRLDEVAYRFELKELQHRVTVLERKAGLA